MLLEISSINSVKVALALRDYFVFGIDRRIACEKNAVSQSYFSISLGKIYRLNELLCTLSKYYNK